MSRRVAVAFMLASAVVQATQCSSGGECPSGGEPQNGVLLLQTKLQINLNGGGAQPRCLLHVGPHKVGSTSVQSLLKHAALLLQSDGWHQPPDLPGRMGPGTKNFGNLAFFLQEGTPNTTEPVWQTFLTWVQARASNRENIVLSSEELDRDSVHISLLASVLAPFRTTVVIGNRLFFEWVPSVYRQISHDTPSIGPLSHWLTPHMATTIGKGELGAGLLFTDGLLRAYARHFDDIRVLELNAAFLKTFVCSFLSASHTCGSLSNESEKRMNVRKAATGDACASQDGCLNRDVRTVLLDRTVSIETEVALLARPPLNVNQTELAQKLDALGLCFC